MTRKIPKMEFKVRSWNIHIGRRRLRLPFSTTGRWIATCWCGYAISVKSYDAANGEMTDHIEDAHPDHELVDPPASASDLASVASCLDLRLAHERQTKRLLLGAVVALGVAGVVYELVRKDRRHGNSRQHIPGV